MVVSDSVSGLPGLDSPVSTPPESCLRTPGGTLPVTMAFTMVARASLGNSMMSARVCPSWPPAAPLTKPHAALRRCFESMVPCRSFSLASGGSAATIAVISAVTSSS